MLLHKLVQDRDGVQVAADYLLSVGVQAPGPDLAVLTDDELIGKAVLQHVGVVVGVVIGEDQRLFPLRQIEGVAHHLGLAVLPGGFAPHIGNIHQDIALLIDVVQNLVELVHRHHEVVQPVGLGVAVKGQLRVGDDRVEEQVLHDAVIGCVWDAVPRAALWHDGGVQDFIGRRLRHRFWFGLRVRLGFGLLRRPGLCPAGGRGGWLRRSGWLSLGGRLGRRIAAPAVGAGGRQQQCQRQQQRNGFFHDDITSHRRLSRRYYALV